MITNWQSQNFLTELEGSSDMNKQIIAISSYDSIENVFYSGGGAKAIHEVSLRLNKKFKVIVITGKYPGSMNTKTIDGIQYYYIGSRINNPQISQLVYQACLPLQLYKTKFDLWIESFTPPFSTNCLQLFTKKPVIGLVHMLSAADMVRKYHLKLFKFIEDLGLRTYRNIIVTNESSGKQIYSQNRNAKIFVIPNGTEVPQKISTVPTFGNVVFLGRLEINQKGLDLLVGAYSLISGKTKSNLVIAGSGSKSQLKSLRKYLQDSGISKRVSLIGRVSGKSKKELFDQAVVVVIPSRFETFSIVALEAMAYARPIVAFDIPGLRWIPEKAISRVKEFDETELSQAIFRIITNKHSADSMGKNGRKFALDYSWQNIAARYEQVISRTLNLHGI